MAAMPLPAGGTTPMMWAAVGCIVFALMLSMAGQFSHSWIVDNEEGLSTGLTTIKEDCSFDEDIEERKQKAAVDRMYRIHLLRRRHGGCRCIKQHGRRHRRCHRWGHRGCLRKHLFAMHGTETLMADLAEDARDTCLERPCAGGTGGLVLWLGSVAALLGTLMLSAGSIGRSLPAEAEKHGKWAAMTPASIGASGCSGVVATDARHRC